MKKFMVTFAAIVAMVMSVGIGSVKTAYAAEWSAAKQPKVFYIVDKTNEEMMDDILESMVFWWENSPYSEVSEIYALDAVIENGEVSMYVEAEYQGEYASDGGFICYEEDLPQMHREIMRMRAAWEAGDWSC